MPDPGRNPGNEILRSSIDDVVQVGEEAVLEAIIVAAADVVVAIIVVVAVVVVVVAAVADVVVVVAGAAHIAVMLSKKTTSERCHSNFPFPGDNETESNLLKNRELRKL